MALKEKPTLLTKWAETVSESHVWKEYPRPQLARQSWINLNVLWSYCITDKQNENPLTSFIEDGLILVPFAIEAALSGVQKALLPSETLWYKRTFQLDCLLDKTILHFGAVDWETSVWINGNLVGKHRGGYCPFSFDIQPYVSIGENEIIVAVHDDTDAGLQERGKQSLQPTGLFYTAVSGIWQTVWIEQLYAQSIKSIEIDSQIQAANVTINGQLFDSEACSVKIDIFDQGMLIATTAFNSENGSFSAQLQLPSVKLWHPDDPHLYDVTITLATLNGERVIDQVSTYFAMREIKVINVNDKPLIALNGKPIFQLGVLDQGYWPDGLYTAASDEALIDDIVQMKKLGFNMLRKHIKVEQARFYYHCDRLGMLVWQDMINGGHRWNMFQEAVLPNLLPNWFRRDDTPRSYKRVGRHDNENRQQFYSELTEMINHLRHFPSIVVWCPFNEGWGQFDAKRVANYVYQLDPTRLIDHASGWFDQKAGHMRSVHIYFRPLSKPKRTYNRVPVLSEFGGYNLKITEHTEAGHKEVGYKKCESKAQLQQLYMQLIAQLSKQIDEGLCASVYTQLSDVEGEVNGIITYDRQVVKLDEEETAIKHHELLRQFEQKWLINN